MYNPYLKPSGTIRAQNLGSGVGCPRAGNCKLCGEYESELTKDGYCRDEKCKRGRLLLKWAEGKAVIYTEDGTGRYKLLKRG